MAVYRELALKVSMDTS